MQKAGPPGPGAAPHPVRETLEVPTRDVEISNRLGIHMRPAMQFVETASRFRSSVAVRKADERVDGKSIYELLGLYAPYGTVLRLEVEGADAEECLEALTALVDSKFSEE
jgi:phosphocarrier protein